MRRGKRWSCSVGLGLCLFALMGNRVAKCQADTSRTRDTSYQDTSYRTPPPPEDFFRPDVRTVPYKVFELYAASLQFDSVYGAADSQRVDFAHGGHIGSGGWAWIEPERGAWAVDSNDLARGRVIARVRAQQTVDSLGYGPRAWTYWWVDKHGPPGDTTWRSLFFSQNLRQAFQAGLKRQTHPRYYWRQSIAKWKGSQWGTCDRSSCCTKE